MSALRHDRAGVGFVGEGGYEFVLGSLAILLIFLSVPTKDQLQGLAAVGKVKK